MSAYADAGNVDQAKVVVAEAVKLDPSNTNAQAFLAQYYVRQATDADSKQKYAVSALAFEQAAALAPSAQQPDLYARAALTYLKIKDQTPNDKAKADADKALAIAPDNALANFAAGISLANQPGKSKDALVYLNKADAASKTGSDPQLTAAVREHHQAIERNEVAHARETRSRPRIKAERAVNPWPRDGQPPASVNRHS